MRENLEEARVLALTQARLLPEARDAAEAYVHLCSRIGRGDAVASGLLDLSRIAIMAGENDAAERLAVRAMRSFSARGETVGAALARASVLRARLQAGRVGTGSLRAGLRAASVLDAAGWRQDELRLRLVVARAALAAGSGKLARTQLALARRLQTRGTVADRIELHHTRALLALAADDPRAAERSLRSGLRLLDEYRAALGAIELRATASGLGSALAQTGVGIALQSGSPENVLTWAEHLRGSSLRVQPVRPPADPKLRALQSELRLATVRRVTTRQASLEAAIRSRSRLVDPSGGASGRLRDIKEARGALGERACVEYVEYAGSLHAVTIVGGTVRLHQLPAESSRDDAEWLRFGLSRLARGRASAAQGVALRDSVWASASALDVSLVQPIQATVGGAALVIVPTGFLHAVPWSALPSLRGRPIEIAPSLTTWVELARLRPSRRRKSVLLAGPRLRHALAEVRSLSSLRPGARVLAGKHATAAATLDALDGAALAHLACHGRFRVDSPLFSALELADGPLNVYELQRLGIAPEIVVLSACDLALSRLHPGDELLGLPAALLGMGARTIIASVIPVPDATAKRLMVAFHRNLVAGLEPAAALAGAQAHETTPGFICIGRG